MDLPDSPLFHEAPIAYSIIDLEGRQLAGNRAYWDLFGYEPDEAGSLDVVSLTHPDDHDRTRRYLSELATGTRESAAVDKRYIRKDGSSFWGRLRASVLRDDAGEPQCMLGVIEDVSDRVEAVERLRAVADERAAFVAAVSHEIRTPLHAILGLAELMVGAGEVTDPEIPVSLLREARSLRLLVEDILDLSRLEIGQVDIEVDSFSPAACLTAVADTVLSQAGERGLEIVADVDPATPELVTGSESRLRQVLVNLMTNAIKFTDDGTVTVSVTPLPGQLLRFSVADTGIGIAPEDQERIFAPFFQLSGCNGGLGLGLAISRRLVELLGGTMQVASVPGGGSRFWFELPLPEAIVAAGGQRPSRPRTFATEPLILVVEDSPVNQLLSRSQLDQLGYRAEVAADGREALARFERDDYAAVLMDWHLPGMDGLETTRRIRAMEREHGWERVPLVALTARTMLGDREECLAAGMDDFLSKPVTIDELDAALARWVLDVEPSSPPVRAAADATLVDETTLRTLADELGDAAIVDSLLATFLTELPKRREAIVAGAFARDMDQIRRSAHTLKSTSAMIGAGELSQACRELETIAAEASPDLADVVARVEEVADRTVAAISLVTISPEDRS